MATTLNLSYLQDRAGLALIIACAAEIPLSNKIESLQQSINGIKK
jgi:hypothetical protein